MDLLPQVSSEYLDKRDLQCGDLAMHEDSCQVQLYLEAYIYLPGKRNNIRDQRGQFLGQNEGHRNTFSYLPCWTITLTLARLIVGDHQRVNLRLGIWFNPDR